MTDTPAPGEPRQAGTPHPVDPPAVDGPPPTPADPTGSPDDPGTAGDDRPPTASATPPPGGFPPFGGSQAGWYPPPAANRFGLVRPRNGRYVAGVCAAVGNATNTDPVLWRVLIGGLTLIGGMGVLLYALAWLLIPAEGDTASPAEPALGRGRSATPPAVTILLGIVAVLVALAATNNGVPPVALTLALVAGVAVLLTRNNPNRMPAPGVPVPPTGPGGPAWPPPGPMAPPAGPMAPPAHGAGPGARPGTESASGPGGPGAGDPATLRFPGTPSSGPAWGTAVPGAPAGSADAGLAGPNPPAGGYRPPYAPYGPYAPARPPYPGAGPGGPGGPGGPYGPGWPPSGSGQPPGPPLVPAAAPVPPAPRRPRSRLGRVVISLVCLALGVLAAVDVAGASVDGPGYLAVALGMIGLGLLVGAWFGRARWLIPVGVVLTLLLGFGSAVDDWEANNRQSGPLRWAPTEVAAVQPDYQVQFGSAVLDLTSVDFTDHVVDVSASVEAGDLRVLLPPNVDVVVTADVGAGNATVIDTSWNGVDVPERTVRNNGPDGVGGGTLNLKAHVNLGNLEVTR